MTGSGLRKWMILLVIATMTVVVAGCGGGGGATSATGSVTPGAPVGPAAVEITLTAAPATGSAAIPVTVAGPSKVPTPDPAYKWPWEIEEPSPKIKQVLMEIVKVSLMPAEEAFGSEDMEGEIQVGSSPDSPAPSDKSQFISTVVDPPVWIDLRKLENGKKLARLLDRFDVVNAGSYDKIRVYYRAVIVKTEDDDTLRFHPTAHSKFDIHFRQGHELVIPATSDTTQQDGWIRFFRVRIDVVGLKLNIVPGGNKKSWKGCKVILRPQVFAEAGNEVLYSVAGTADNVFFQPDPPPVSGNFDVFFGTGTRIIPVVFDNNTTWAYSDNILGRYPWSWFVGNVSNTTAVTAFRDDAKVMAIGAFDPSLTLHASDIVFSFPVVREGVADNVWLPPDNVAFILRSDVDNVAVYPKPGRNTAYYDNAVVDPVDNQHHPLSQAAIDNNVEVKARGYFTTGGIEAFWISIGEFVPVVP